MKVTTGTIISVLLVIFLLGIGTISAVIYEKKRQEEKREVAQLRDDYNSAASERDKLADSLRILRQAKKTLEVLARQTNLEYANLVKYTRNIEEKHQRLIDSISTIPPDTAYHELQSVFPTKQPLTFPFSGEQVNLIYTDVVSLSLAEHQLTLKNQLINKCNQVSRNQQDIISNMHYQNALLTQSGEMADIQITSLQRRLDLAAKDNKEKTVWNKIYKTAAASEFVYIVIKTFTK